MIEVKFFHAFCIIYGLLFILLCDKAFSSIFKKQNICRFVRGFIVIIILGLTGHLFAGNAEMNPETLRSLIDKNLRYSKDVPADSIIVWGERLEPILLKNRQYQDFFETKYIVAQTYAMRGDINLAIEKAHLISKKAQQLKSEFGFAMTSQAVGDTYVYTNVPKEAITSYNQALEILSKHPHMDVFKTRVLIRLLLLHLQENDIEEHHNYLIMFNNLIPEEDTENPLYVYRLLFNTAYNIKLGLLDKSKISITKLNEYAAQRTDMPLHYLAYISALYNEKINNTEAALANYEQLISILETDFNPIEQDLIIKGYTSLLIRIGKADEACEFYLNTNIRKDSISVNRYTRLGSLLHANYQIDTMKLENQTKRNNMVHMAITVSFITFLLFVLLATYMRISNKKLAASKQSLEKAKQRAEASIRSKNIFLSNMSHEIRTPLNALSGFSSILTEEGIDYKTRVQCTEIIQQNSDLLLKLIDDVIDLSGLEFGEMQFNFKEHNAINICQNVIEMVQKIKQTKANILFTTPLKELTLYTDDARLQQVLINLLINATKFTPTGSITLDLSLRSENMVLFTVTDTGCGIPKEKRDKIFNRFEKLDEHHHGAGLGLSICQLIIKRVGGEIWIDSDYTEGSRFCFTHPIKTSENA